MLPLAHAGLTTPAVAGPGCNEWLGLTRAAWDIGQNFVWPEALKIELLWRLDFLGCPPVFRYVVGSKARKPTKHCEYEFSQLPAANVSHRHICEHGGQLLSFEALSQEAKVFWFKVSFFGWNDVYVDGGVSVQRYNPRIGLTRQTLAQERGKAKCTWHRDDDDRGVHCVGEA